MIKNIIQNIFTKNNFQCSCKKSLDQNTCDLAFQWIFYKFNSNNDIKYLKETYQKINQSESGNTIKIKEQNCINQIDKDIIRTYPEHKGFQNDQQKQNELRNMLINFSKYDPQVGYVQGMNMIGAAILYHAEEYLAFWIMTLIFEKLEIRDVYLPQLPGLKKHSQIIEILLKQQQEIIYDHFQQVNFINKVKLQIMDLITKWIFTLFGTVFPLNSIHKLYNKILQEGWPFIYQVILAILITYKKQILKLDQLEILILLQQDYNKNLNLNQLFQIANKIKLDKSNIQI